MRRADPSKRDRTKPLPKPVIRTDDTRAEASAPKDRENTRRDKAEYPDEKRIKIERNADHRTTKNKTDSTGQRNHRFDGKPREADTRQAEKPAKQAGLDMRDTPRREKNEPQYRQTPRRGGKVRDGYDASVKRVTTIPTVSSELPRLSKVMAERGLCSRREADNWIVNGWVKVNGAVVDTLGTRVAPDAEILISGYAKEHQAENVTILLHKPVGFVSGQAEDGYEPAAVLIKPENQWPEDTTKKTFKRGILKGLAPAGRLDIDSTGLLVLTQDGRVARHLIGEDSSVEKEYLVRVEGELSENGLKKLNHGLSLDGAALKPAKVSWQNEDQLRFVLREGKKRQIRRMCELVGLQVVGLKRIRIGSVTLGKLPMGQWRYLRADERF